MAISKKLLNPGEHLVVSGRQHPKALFWPLLALIVLLAIGLFVQLATDSHVLHLIVWVLVIIAIVWFCLRPFVVWLTSVHAFTDRRLITRQGVFTRTGHDIPLARVSDIGIEINLIDRPFGCGSLLIADASTNGMVRLNDIPHVEETHRRLNELLYQLHKGPTDRRTDDGS